TPPWTIRKEAPVWLIRASASPKASLDTELLSFVGLTSKAWDHPNQLSGGQMQRVGIARALATKPSILLADESTSALDPETTADVLSLLKRVNEVLGVTVVVITHEMEVVRSIAQQVSVLEAGHLVETGSARQVFAHPQSETTQRFLSTIIGQHPSGEEEARLRSENPGTRLVDVSSVSSDAFGDALARISQTGASFRIVHGGVIEVHGGSLGNYTVALSGSDEAVEKAARILTDASDTAATTTTSQEDH
ncbi:MAG: ATP-binding cassette domain-containing protein, partial [Cutibacterium avidum]|nr:ATP-binding cassette domain-containing protein [Cutibacterium avidum]